jgi:hypothetical protein
MRLLCNFEDEFDEDVWSKLTEEVDSDVSQNVVALASFSGTEYIISSLLDLYSFSYSVANYNGLNFSFVGDKRFFACTGIAIGCSEFTTRVLTSASLVRNSDDQAKVADNLKVRGSVIY